MLSTFISGRGNNIFFPLSIPTRICGLFPAFFVEHVIAILMTVHRSHCGVGKRAACLVILPFLAIAARVLVEIESALRIHNLGNK